MAWYLNPTQQNNHVSQSLEEVQPLFGTIPPYCLTLGSFIHVGSFLCLVNNVIIRFIRLLDDGCIGNVYDALSEEQKSQNVNEIESYVKGLNGRELVQTSSLIKFQLHHVQDVSFVFSPSDIQQNHIVMHGIQNSFYCCYSKLLSTDLQPIQDFSCFPCSHEEAIFGNPSFPLRIWQSLTDLQDQFRSMLSYSNEKQGNFVPNKRRKIKFPSECFKYLCKKVHMKPKEFLMRSIQQRMLSGASVMTVRIVEAGQLLVFETTEHFDALESLLGSFILFHFRRKRPLLGQTHTLQESIGNNVFNLISTKNTQCNPEETVSLNGRVTLKMGERDLTITLSFTRWSYENYDERGLPSDCPLPSLQRTILGFRPAVVVASTHPTMVRVGDRFMHQQQKWKVTVIGPGWINAKRVAGGAGSIETFQDVDRVKNAIADYYK
jgi:hypothetical protein